MSLLFASKLLLVSRRATVSQVEWTTPGTYTWTVPNNVYFISVVCVGAGGGGSTANNAGGGGGGGGLAYMNVIPVTPGQQFTVVVGAGGAGNGGASLFGSLVEASGGLAGGGVLGGDGGAMVKGDGGGTGGAGGARTSTTTTTPESTSWGSYQYNAPPTAPHWTVTPTFAQIRYGSWLSSQFSRTATVVNREGTNLRYQRGTQMGTSAGGEGHVYYSVRQGTVTPESSETTYRGGGGGGAGGYEGDGGVGGRGGSSGATSASGGNGGFGNGSNGGGISLQGYGGPGLLVGGGGGAKGGGLAGGVRIIFPGKDRMFPTTRVINE